MAKTAKATAPAPAPKAQPKAVPKVAAEGDPLLSYWVYSKAFADAQGQPMGYMLLPKSVGDAAVAADMAQATPQDGMSLKYREGDEPGGYPYTPTPAPAHTAPITAISAENPAVATTTQEGADAIRSMVAKKITITNATGADAAQINKTWTMGVRSDTTFALDGLDNTGPLDFGGYPLTGILST